MGSNGAVMNNVISLQDRLETWNVVFESHPTRASVSSRGRIRIETFEKTTILDLVQGANFISSLQKGIDSLYKTESSD